MVFWVVRAGRGGVIKSEAVSKSIIGIGWEKIPDLSNTKQREQINDFYARAYPNDTKRQSIIRTAQIWNFAHNIKKGDLVAMPLKSTVMIGIVVGHYQYNKQSKHAPHQIPVTWKKEMKRSEFDLDIQNSLGGQLSVGRVHAKIAEQRVRDKLDQKSTEVFEKSSDNELLECLMAVTSEETEKCQKQLMSTLEGAGEWLNIKIGYQGGNARADILWFEKYELWFAPRKVETHYWNAFGVSNSRDNLTSKGQSITCEINPPFDPSNNQTLGRFLKDDNDKYYLAHVGRFQNNSKWISLNDHVNWPRTSICGHKKSVFIISRLDDDRLISNLQQFVRTIHDIKTSTSPPQPPAYAIQDIIKEGCFVSESDLDSALHTLKRKQNLILQGPPGTGKTWLAKRLAYVLIGIKTHEHMLPIQFHPNMSYEDFVRGWRPTAVENTDNGSMSGLRLVDGPFMEHAEKARNDPKHQYVVIIEEINRGNPANIFGEMLTLLEADKRKPEEALNLSYRRKDEEKFFIPQNLYVIGTMNTADRSIARVDMALRRRFGSVRLHPIFNESWREYVQQQHPRVGDGFLRQVAERMTALNESIRNEQTLGRDFEVGHSYLVPHDGDTLIDSDPKKWFEQIVKNEIVPHLREHCWPRDDERVDIEEKKLLKI